MGSYSLSASYYDRLYADKDYAGEVQGLLEALRTRGLSAGDCLDLACGTGRHLEHLAGSFRCQGLDLEPGLLEHAARRVPGATFHAADMLDFSLPGQQFDLITCFFGSVGYLGSLERLHQAVRHWSSYLKPGGYVAIERWLDPGDFKPGRVFANFVDEPDFKLTRMVVSASSGTLYDSDFHYLLATPKGVEHWVERHQLRMFTHQEYLEALAELQPELAPELAMRGMYLGQSKRATRDAAGPLEAGHSI